MPEKSDAPDADLAFVLPDPELRALLVKHAEAFQVTALELVQAVTVDFMADLYAWRKTFPDAPMMLPPLRRDPVTNELFLGAKLLASLVDTKLAFMAKAKENGTTLGELAAGPAPTPKNRRMGKVLGFKPVDDKPDGGDKGKAN